MAEYAQLNEDDDSNNLTVPAYKDIESLYEGRWVKAKEKFQTEIRHNFHALIQRYARGKQEVYCLSVPQQKFRLYEAAFLELFDSGYAPHVGDTERLAGKATKRLYITLPIS